MPICTLHSSPKGLSLPICTPNPPFFALNLTLMPQVPTFEPPKASHSLSGPQNPVFMSSGPHLRPSVPFIRASRPPFSSPAPQNPLFSPPNPTSMPPKASLSSPTPQNPPLTPQILHFLLQVPHFGPRIPHVGPKRPRPAGPASLSSRLLPAQAGVPCRVQAGPAGSDGAEEEETNGD